MHLLLFPRGKLYPEKIWRATKLITLILFTACLQLNARSWAQGITLNLEGVPLEQVFTQIEKQTGYHFIYSKETIQEAKRVNIQVKQAPIGDVLALCFKGQPLTYTITDKYIVVKEKKASPLYLPQSSADSDTLHGTIINENGAPIPGATVTVKGTNIATVANEEGEFLLPSIGNNSVLLIRSVGFEKEEMHLNGEHFVTITLKKALNKLEETVIIAYGTTTKKLNIGSISKISANEIKRQPVSNPIATMEGLVPGLFITQSNGLPGSNFEVQIRGRNSIQQGNSPLYIIDGIPFDPTNPSQNTGSINVNNPFNTINPNSIASIEVLKDADATSIYGSRGANGVILITTKKAEAGKLSFSFSGYTGWSKVTRTLNMLSGEQYRELRREAFENDGLAPNMSNAHDLLWNDTTVTNDWTNIMIGGTAKTNNVDFRLSGGSEQTTFAIGANYYKETTVFPGDNSAKRKSLNATINHTSKDGKFKVNLISSYSYNSSNLLPMDLTKDITLPPYGFNLKDQNGNLVWDDGAKYSGNPLAQLEQHYNGITDMVHTSMLLNYKILNGLNLKIDGGYNLLDFDQTIITPSTAFDPEYRQYGIGNASFGHNKQRNWSLEPQLNYNTKIGEKIKMMALIGSSFQSNEGRKNYMAGSGYVSDALINSITGASFITATNDYYLYRYNAIFAKVSFNWEDTYLINLSGRRDGSSRFATGKQFANFGAIGAAWIFSNLKSLNQSEFISFGKVRASYGTSGNDQIGNYGYLDSYIATTYPYQQSLSLIPNGLYNNEYSWEQFRKLDVGIDVGFFDNRIYASLDFYRNRSLNQLIYYSLPSQTGFQNIVRNFPGIVQNIGWEIQMESENIKNTSFSWSTKINLSIPRNKLLSFPGLAESSYSNRYAIGQPLNVQIGYKFLGVNPETGSYMIFDKNQDGEYNRDDYLIIGNTDPKFYGGMLNNITYKNIGLSIHFQFVKQIGLHPIYAQSGPLGIDGNRPSYVLNHWRKKGDHVPYAKATITYGSDLYNSYSLASESSARLTDASFIRLRNISLYYTIPKKMTDRLKVGSANINLNCENLLTITNYAGPDPENQTLFALPPLRVISLGFDISF